MAAIDPFAGISLGQSFRNAQAIVPSDTVDLPNPALALFVGVAGDVKVDMAGGQTVVFKAVAVGIFRIAVTRVYATGTAATNLDALW